MMNDKKSTRIKLLQILISTENSHFSIRLILFSQHNIYIFITIYLKKLWRIFWQKKSIKSILKNKAIKLYL